MKSHGPWTILGTREIYHDRWIEVDRDDVIRPDGAEGTHVVVRIKPGVSVLALDEEGAVYLTDEFHYGIGRDSLEAVSGGIEPGEGALETAQRELQEELGLSARRWDELGSVDPFTTIVVSPTRLYLARGLTLGEAAPEGTERIRRVRLPLADAVERVLSGEITHAPTAVLILKAERLLRDETT